MLLAKHGPDSLGPRWSTTEGHQDLDTRVRQLEIHVATLEATLEHDRARLKAEIWGEIWEQRLKGLFIISVGIAVVMWVRLLAG